MEKRHGTSRQPQSLTYVLFYLVFLGLGRYGTPTTVFARQLESRHIRAVSKHDPTSNGATSQAFACTEEEVNLTASSGPEQHSHHILTTPNRQPQACRHEAKASGSIPSTYSPYFSPTITYANRDSSMSTALPHLSSLR